MRGPPNTWPGLPTRRRPGDLGKSRAVIAGCSVSAENGNYGESALNFCSVRASPQHRCQIKFAVSATPVMSPAGVLRSAISEGEPTWSTHVFYRSLEP